MSNESDIRRFRQYLSAERDAVYLYEQIAAAEPNPDLATVYRRLAATERRHAENWAARLREAGAQVPDARPSLRARLLGKVAGRFGAAAVLPSLLADEQGASGGYAGQSGLTETTMAAQERSHARVFRYLATQTKGLEGSAVARLEGRHRSTGGNALRAGVLGANDGLVSNLSLVMGVAGAQMAPRAVLVTGLAGLLAGALSMALGEWLSVQSSRELYQHQIEIEDAELDAIPDEEREELALIYQAKGIPAEQARSLADRLLSDKATALDTLAREELGIDPNELGGSAWQAAWTSFGLFALGAILPVLPYFFLGGMAATAASAALSAIGLFAIGASITLVTGRSFLHSGIRQVLFGLLAAGITFGIGRLIGVSLAG